MKLSVILVSVNIAASLPVAIGSAAMADDAVNAKSNWLKSSLASLDDGKKESAARHKLSFSEPAADTGVSLKSSHVKMRPFVPGRKLPSQKELEFALMSQTPKMAQQPILTQLMEETPTMAQSAQLNGQVSDNYVRHDDAISTYGNVGYIRQTSSRVLPGQTPVLAGQVRQLRTKKARSQARQQLEQLTKPTRKQTTSAPQPVPDDASQSMPSDEELTSPEVAQTRLPALNQPEAMVPEQVMQIPQRNMTPQEQVMIDRLVDSAHPHTFAQPTAGDLQPQEPPVSGAGPAPFPLSLLPQDQLKDLISGGRRRRGDAPPPAFFGSWHNTNLSGLPAGGFQSHTQSMRSPSFSTYAPRPRAPRTVHSSANAISAAPAVGGNDNVRSIGQLRRLQPQDIKVATYPPYARFSRPMAY